MNNLFDALAWTLVHFLWQGTVIAVAAHGVLALLRRRSAHLRYLVAAFALLVMAASVTGTFVSLRASRTVAPVRMEPVSEVPAGVFRESGIVIEEGATRVRNAVRSVARVVVVRSGYPLRDWKAGIAMAWIAGVCGLSLWRLVGLIGIARLRRRTLSPPAGLVADFEALRAAMRVTGRVVLRVSEIARVPLVVGTLRPLVLVPVSALAGLTPEQLRAVLAHELAHVRRHDYLVNLLQTAVETLLFFHPGVWWLGRTLRREREHACDDRAVAVCRDKVLFARALGELVRVNTVASPVLAMTSGRRRGEMLRRVRRIVGRSATSGRGGLWSVLLLLGILGTGGLVVGKAMGEPKEKPVAEKKTRGRILDREGRVLAETVDGQRRYPNGALAAHVIGWVVRGEGNDGVEKSGEETLKKGDLRLTLDLEKQFVVESVLREKGIGRGAVVVVDPRNGDVLAIASVPSYDPGVWVPKMTVENYAKLTEDKSSPLRNRAIQSFSPGSTFKIASALLARDADQVFPCEGFIEFNNGARRNKMKCWIAAKGGKHGDVALTEAIDVSCNCYFYQLGIAAGMQRLHDTAGLLGLGRRTGIELPSEGAGRVPDAAFLEKTVWKPSPSLDANTAIGQGHCLASPLQMAAAIATVGNGGGRHAPRLFLDRERMDPENILEKGVDPAVLEALRTGLWRSVNEADHVGRGAKSDEIVIAGKTGTAQYERQGVPDNQGWFVSFAPYENPRYAMAVLVEGAKSGGAVCAPLTRLLLERFAELDAGGTLDVVPLEAAKGHLEPIEAIDP